MNTSCNTQCSACWLPLKCSQHPGVTVPSELQEPLIVTPPPQMKGPVLHGNTGGFAVEAKHLGVVKNGKRKMMQVWGALAFGVLGSPLLRGWQQWDGR